MNNKDKLPFVSLLQCIRFPLLLLFLLSVMTILYQSGYKSFIFIPPILLSLYFFKAYILNPEGFVIEGVALICVIFLFAGYFGYLMIKEDIKQEHSHYEIYESISKGIDKIDITNLEQTDKESVSNKALKEGYIIQEKDEKILLRKPKLTVDGKEL